MSKRAGVVSRPPRLERWARVALSLLLAASCFTVPSLGQDRSEKREVKRQIKQADEALARNDLRAAQQLFRALAARVPSGDALRTRVLYGVALTHVLSSAGDEDLAAGRAALNELGALAEAPHEVERTALIQLLDAFEALAAEQAKAQRAQEDAAKLETRLSALEDRRRSMVAKAAAEEAAVADERSELESQLATANETITALMEELATTRGELESRERTLDQLRQKLVGDG